MKHLKKFPGFNLHLRIFILISLTFFILAGIAHVTLIFTEQSMSIGEVMLPRATSYFALFGIVWMVIMGMYYYVALAPNKK